VQNRVGAAFVRLRCVRGSAGVGMSHWAVRAGVCGDGDKATKDGQVALMRTARSDGRRVVASAVASRSVRRAMASIRSVLRFGLRNM